TADDVVLQQSVDGVHYHLKLYAKLFKVNAPIDVKLGLDGLGLQVDGNVQLNAGIDADLGFGLSKQYGFYVDAGDSVGVTFTAQIPPPEPGKPLITGKLGFFQVDVSTLGSTP